MKYIVVGDVHGYWGDFNKVINKLENKNKDEQLTFICCGDFGFWPLIKSFKVRSYGSMGEPLIKRKENLHPKDGIKKRENTIIRWCDGNHEDHQSLQELESNEIGPNIFYHPRGSYITLEDGRNMLFIGGAHSIDEYLRTPYWTWFPQETITQKDLDNLPDIRVDIVISHTCPTEWEHLLLRNREHPEPSRLALSIVLNRYKPDLWYHGHWHQFKKGKYNNTYWTCLNKSGSENWYEFLIENN